MKIIDRDDDEIPRRDVAEFAGVIPIDAEVVIARTPATEALRADVDLDEALGRAKRRLAAIRALQITECVCGRSKKEGHSFCFGCYRRLRPQMRLALYTRIGEGYTEIYEEAKRVLGFGKEGTLEACAPRECDGDEGDGGDAA